jgi:hypothetical protein
MPMLERGDAKPEVYARMHRVFLEKHHPRTYKMLKESGGLVDHLKMVGETAVSLYETISTQMATSKDLPKDYAERVKELERIPHVGRGNRPERRGLQPNAVVSEADIAAAIAAHTARWGGTRHSSRLFPTIASRVRQTPDWLGPVPLLSWQTRNDAGPLNPTSRN